MSLTLMLATFRGESWILLISGKKSPLKYGGTSRLVDAVFSRTWWLNSASWYWFLLNFGLHAVSKKLLIRLASALSCILNRPSPPLLVCLYRASCRLNLLGLGSLSIFQEQEIYISQRLGLGAFCNHCSSQRVTLPCQPAQILE